MEDKSKCLKFINAYCKIILFISILGLLFLGVYITTLGNDVEDIICIPRNNTIQEDDIGISRDFLIKVRPNEFKDKPEFSREYIEIITNLVDSEYIQNTTNIITRWPLWAELKLNINNKQHCLINYSKINLRYTNITSVVYAQNYRNSALIILKIFLLLIIVSAVWIIT